MHINANSIYYQLKFYYSVIYGGTNLQMWCGSKSDRKELNTQHGLINKV